MGNANFVVNKERSDLEKRLKKILDNNFPGLFEFVGDGRISIGEYYPDFIGKNGKMQIIETLGCYYHHCSKCKKGTIQKQEISIEKNAIRQGIYSIQGYDSLLIWGHEFNDMPVLVEKLRQFIER